VRVTRAKSCIALAQLLDERRVYLYLDTLHIDALDLIGSLLASFQVPAAAAICLTLLLAFALPLESRSLLAGRTIASLPLRADAAPNETR